MVNVGLESSEMSVYIMQYDRERNEIMLGDTPNFFMENNPT